MSVEITPVEVAVAAPVEVAAPVKVVRVELPEVAVENYKILPFSEVAGTVTVAVDSLEEYAQVSAVLKTMKNVVYVSGNKGAIAIVDAKHLINAEKLVLISPELKAEGIDQVVFKINFNGAEKLRLSAKTTGTSKVKPSIRNAFFDLDLNGMVDMGEFNYIFGVEGTEFTKELNTKILRIVKGLVADGKLYSDEDKSGFHKGKTRIPPEARTKDNYAWYFKWSEIKTKLDAAGLNGDETVANIVKIINEVYPTIVVDTTKDLWLEALVSEFAAIKSEKFDFDIETGKIVSRKEEEALKKAQALQAKNDLKAKNDAEKKANKKAKAKEEAETASDVVVDLGTAVEGNAATDVTALNETNVLPMGAVAAPAVGVAQLSPSIDAASLISGLNPISK